MDPNIPTRVGVSKECAWCMVGVRWDRAWRIHEMCFSVLGMWLPLWFVYICLTCAWSVLHDLVCDWSLVEVYFDLASCVFGLRMLCFECVWNVFVVWLDYIEMF